LYGAFNAIDFVITAAFYELSRHPEWIEILRTEFDRVLGDRAYPTREDFAALPNTINFMREVMRLYPVAAGVTRRTGTELEVEGEHVPSGTDVMIAIAALHRHPDFWDYPNQFDPHRWAELSNHVPAAYIPFLKGARQCIGRHWAELEFVVVLVTLLRQFDLNLHDRNIPVSPFLIPRFTRKMPYTIAKTDRNSNHAL
jgi:cytochrome P450